MNREQAIKTIREMFTQAFDKTRFGNFAVNLLNHIDEAKASQWNSQYVKNAFKDHIQHYERLGTYTSPQNEKLDVLIVHLTTESKLERARTAIRNFVADHLKTRDEKDAALVAFVSPSETTWRFSYVKMEYATVEKDSGKVGVETRLTPARRFSYIVGEGESSHTAQTRFLDMLQDTEIAPSLSDIEEAFSVEAVSKEFFKKYHDLFEEIHKTLDKMVAGNKTVRDEFQTKNVNTVDFAKKLMGQIVFLYFLQKKGWLGVDKSKDWGTGPRDFLRRLADKKYGQYENFFNDILEPLFYDTLATDRGHEAFCRHFKCRIPFLNGGLFEPLGNYDWRETDIFLPNRLFTNTDYVEEGIIGTGVLDVFDRYNFTVNESEPLEKEVAIDPEMLGKVFENLIEENRRKGTGAYYTPREIVHYMCQESLINYLETAVNKDKVLVPREDIETLVHLGEQISHYESVDTDYHIKMPKSIKEHSRLIDEKLSEITVCDPAVGSGAFPVGIMTEIVHARCALTPYFTDIQERTPYYFKRHAIQNCLYGVDIDPGAVEIAKLRLWLSLVVDEEDVKLIKPLPNLDYKIVPGNSLLGVEKTLFNEKLFKRLEEFKSSYFNETDRDRKASLKDKIEAIILDLTKSKEKFDFKIYFSEVFYRKGGFDVVVANPPYLVLSADFPNLDYFETCYYVSRGGKKNLYKLFFERGINLLRKQGALSFISPNNYLTSADSFFLRDLLVKETCIHEIIEHSESDKVFDAVTQAVCTIVLTKTDVKNPKISYYRNKVQALIDQNEVLNHSRRFIKNTSPLIKKMERQPHNLDDFTIGYQGEVNVSTKKKHFSFTPSSSKYLPLVRGNQVKKYSTQNFPSEYCPISVQTRGHYAQERVVFQEVVNAGIERRINSTLMSDVLCGHTTNYLISKSPKVSNKFLIALINSRLVNYYFKFYNQTNHVPIGEIKQIPAPNFHTVKQEAFVSLVDSILSAKKRDPDADTTALEREIDRLVYKLYDLTREEIAIVEGSGGK
jgi:type I restriction-modification system DNA methylase subunit